MFDAYLISLQVKNWSPGLPANLADVFKSYESARYPCISCLCYLKSSVIIKKQTTEQFMLVFEMVTKIWARASSYVTQSFYFEPDSLSFLQNKGCGG